MLHIQYNLHARIQYIYMYLAYRFTYVHMYGVHVSERVIEKLLKIP